MLRQFECEWFKRTTNAIDAMQQFIQIALCSICLVSWFISMLPNVAEAQEGRDVPLRNVSSNLFADVIGAQQNDGQGVILFDFNGNKNQMFSLKMKREGPFKAFGTPVGPFLIAMHSDKCLTVQNASLNDSARIIQFRCASVNSDSPDENALMQSQIWDIENVGRPAVDCPHGCFPIGFRIRNRGSGKCIDAGNSNFPTPPPRNAILQQITCVRDTGDRNFVNQVFDFTLPGAGPVVK
jgi:hypothetical protein